MKMFVEKLKGSVIDKSLQVVMQAKIKATSSTKVSMWIGSSEEQVITIEDPNGNVISSMTVTADGEITYGVADMTGYDYVNYVIPKANAIKRLYGHVSGTYGGAPDSKYYAKLENFSFGQTQNKEDGFIRINLSDSNFIDDIFMSWESINIISNAASENHHISNIEFMGGCINLTQILRYAGMTEDIYGEFTYIFEDMCKNGRQAGTISVEWRGINSYCTFNGKRIQAVNFTVTFNSSGCVVTAGDNFYNMTGYSSATYDVEMDAWTFA